MPMRVGASDLQETLAAWAAHRQKIRFAQVLQACKDGDIQQPADDGPFDCTAMVTEVAALAYRDRSFGAESVSDAGSALTVAGLLGALIEYGQSASAVRWTGFVGVIPIISEAALQMRPRERLYLISAGAMTAITYRYSQLHRLATDPETQADLDRAAPDAIAGACAKINALAGQVAKWPIVSEQLAVATELQDLNTRCAALATADATLIANVAALKQAKDPKAAAAALALDATALDDQVALLDRELRSTPTQAFRETLGAPFSLVGKILSGAAQPSALSDTATALFAKPYTLTLTLAPTVTAVTLPPAPLAMNPQVAALVAATQANAASAKKADRAKAQADAKAVRRFQCEAAYQLNQLNRWLIDLTDASGAIPQLQALAAKPVLTIDYTANNQPVTFAKPPGS